MSERDAANRLFLGFIEALLKLAGDAEEEAA